MAEDKQCLKEDLDVLELHLAYDVSEIETKFLEFLAFGRDFNHNWPSL